MKVKVCFIICAMPGQKCCVCGNTNVTDKTAGFHRFPATSKDPTRRSAWLSVFQMSEDDIIPSTRVCSRHFPDGDSTKVPSLALGKFNM